MNSEFERLIQIGIVTAVDKSAHKVRVKFQDTELISDWLSVLKNAPTLSLGAAGAHTHSGTITVNTAEDHTHETSASIEKAGEHQHDLSVSLWMPRVNDTVLVVYLPVFNSDGFVIGGI